jgi:hypothetical protein
VSLPLSSRCPRIEDAAAYVLGALDDPDAFREHARTCATCGEEIVRLASLPAALAAAPLSVRAPQAMRQRILDRVTAEAEVLNASGPQADRPPRARVPLARRWRFSGAAAALALAAGLVIALAGGGGSPRTTYATASGAATGARAMLRQYGGRAELSVSHMPQAPLGKVYEVWLKRPGGAPQPTDALFSVTNDGRGTVNVPSGLRHVAEVMVTSEPIGGSEHPTSAPLLTFRLT